MAHDTLYAIGEALIDMIPSKTGCSFAEVPSFSPRVGGAPANVCGAYARPVSYTHLTLPTTPYV